MQSFIGLALMVSVIIRGSLKTPLDIYTVKEAWLELDKNSFPVEFMGNQTN